MLNLIERCGRVDLIVCKLRMGRCRHIWRRSTPNESRSKRSCENWKGKTMTEIDRILDQLKRAFEGNAWHGPSVREVLEGVTAEQAVARPLPGGHTIWELTHHIAVWEGAGRRRLEGDHAQIDISSPEDWPPADDASEEAWEKSKAA